MMPPTPLPGTLQQTRFDTLVLVPASLLSFKAAWQQLANELPVGSTLIVLPSSGSLQSEAVEKIAASFEALGWAVTTLPASEIAKLGQLRLLVG
jgi:hypothetical protein